MKGVQMENVENIKLSVDTPRGLLNALLISQNSMVPECIIECNGSRNMFGDNPLQELQQTTNYINSLDGSFAKSQLGATTYEYRQYPFLHKAFVKINRAYMCTPKELNDVRCVAAEIGGILKVNLGKRYAFEQAVREYQKWINHFFDYKNTGHISDHTAIGLLTNRTGVCQSIAAVTMLVFPYLGYPVIYVSGDAKGGREWGPHAWNAVLTEKGWAHVDFTFGMSSFITPSTNNAIFTKAFVQDHKWDERCFSSQSMTKYTELVNGIFNSSVELFENKKTFIIGDVSVSTVEPVLIGNESEGHWVNLFRLMPLIGGACELLTKTDQLRICLYNKEIIINHASSVINGSNGYVGISVINKFATVLGGNNTSITFKVR